MRTRDPSRPEALHAHAAEHVNTADTPLTTLADGLGAPIDVLPPSQRRTWESVRAPTGPTRAHEPVVVIEFGRGDGGSRSPSLPAKRGWLSVVQNHGRTSRRLLLVLASPGSHSTQKVVVHQHPHPGGQAEPAASANGDDRRRCADDPRRVK
uniref:Uncharacterized protein n=1 Tax=Mycena chlorophos TaxID=658473 RepID=A0ABQ0LB29_MYCCL|nr:predicted protein [Mycena chlorophos]